MWCDDTGTPCINQASCITDRPRAERLHLIRVKPRRASVGKSSDCRLNPGGLLARVVNVAFLVDPEAQLGELVECPPAGHRALPAVFAVYGVAQLDVVGPAAHGLGVGPLEAAAVFLAFGGARTGALVGGAVVGNGRDGEVVPPVLAGAFAEERVRVREEGGVDEGFLLTSVNACRFGSRG